MKIYTDGSCLPFNGKTGGPGHGGWSCCIIDDDVNEVLLSGHEKGTTTNNRMELMAVIEALQFIEATTTKTIRIYSDSQLTIKCAKGVWKRNANLDLWSQFDKVSSGKVIDFEWVKAHNGDMYNEMVDQAALSEARKAQNENLS